jgi:hypothetical protein
MPAAFYSYFGEAQSLARALVRSVTAAKLWPAFTQQFHHRDHHVEDRPRRCQNNYRKYRHFLRPFPRSFNPVFASQIVKIPEPRPVLSIVRREIPAMPLAKTGMETVVRLRELSLVPRGRTPRFHSCDPYLSGNR